MYASLICATSRAPCPSTHWRIRAVRSGPSASPCTTTCVAPELRMSGQARSCAVSGSPARAARSVQIVRRKVSAVPVHQRPPVEHRQIRVADLPRDVAEREARRAPRPAGARRWRGPVAARTPGWWREAQGRRRSPPARPSGIGKAAASASARLQTTGKKRGPTRPREREVPGRGGPRESQHHDHRESRRYAQAVKARHVRVQPRIDRGVSQRIAEHRRQWTERQPRREQRGGHGPRHRLPNEPPHAGTCRARRGPE